MEVNEIDEAAEKARSCGLQKYSTGKGLEEIFPVKKPKLQFEPIAISASMVNFEKQSMIQFMLTDDEAEVNDTSNPEAAVVTIRVPSEGPVDRNLVIQKIFEQQRESELLRQLCNQQTVSLPRCCEDTYNNKIPCVPEDICNETALDKGKWIQCRKHRITASTAYGLYTYKKDDWEQKSFKYFFPKKFSSKYVEHGLKYEAEARDAYSRELQCHVQEVGLIVNESSPWLAASPDGVIVENGIPIKLLEIRCPFIGRSESSATIEAHCKFLKRETGKLVLKKKHQYYAQVQINMALLNVQWCDFVIFCSINKSFIIVKVPFDISYTKALLFKLKNVYFGKMLHTLCT